MEPITSDPELWDRQWVEWHALPREELLGYFPRQVFRPLPAALALAGKSVLEIGCGSGRLSYYARQAGAAEICLVDASPHALAIARRLWGDEGDVTFVQADALTLDLGRKFDLVFSSGLLEHFQGEPLARLAAAHVRHAREHVAAIVPAHTVFNRRNAARLAMQARYGWERPFTRAEMRRLFEQAGLRVTHNARYYLTYGVPLPNLRGKARLERWLDGLTGLERWWGGLLLTVGEVVSQPA